MKGFRMIRRIACMAAALALLLSACCAEGAFEAAEEGLDLTETVSVRYPAVRGGADGETAEKVNSLIREDCRIGDYLARMPLLLSGGKVGAGHGVLAREFR